jgi:hypothetical protein
MVLSRANACQGRPPGAVGTVPACHGCQAGYHVMFAHLAKPLVNGEKVKATLSFERAGQVAVEFPVEGLGASGPAATTGDSMGGMKM